VPVDSSGVLNQLLLGCKQYGHLQTSIADEILSIALLSQRACARLHFSCGHALRKLCNVADEMKMGCSLGSRSIREI